MSDRPIPAPKPAPEKSPLERTAELTRRIIAVPKTKIMPKRRIKRGRH